MRSCAFPSRGREGTSPTRMYLARKRKRREGEGRGSFITFNAEKLKRTAFSIYVFSANFLNYYSC